MAPLSLAAQEGRETEPRWRNEWPGPAQGGACGWGASGPLQRPSASKVSSPSPRARSRAAGASGLGRWASWAAGCAQEAGRHAWKPSTSGLTESSLVLAEFIGLEKPVG